jgi:Na+/H+-dicarboxylate symporter
MLLGITAALFSSDKITHIISRGKALSERILGNFFSPVIPFFILGFVARMHQQKFLDQMYTQCAQLVLVLTLFLGLYIAFLFLAGNSFSPKKAYSDLYNLLPAAGVAFTSGSGLATMPWTIAGTSKNLSNKDFAQAVIPATTNIQQIGDCIINAFLCFLLYQHFFGHAPDVATWIPFTCMFVLARFTTAAVLGGAIFIMIPIYESYLSFNAEMVAIILAFNVILDPIVTCSNVVANGALCKIFEKIWRPIGSLE